MIGPQATKRGALVGFLRRRGLSLLSITMFGGYGTHLIAHADPTGLVCFGALVATLGVEWLHSRVNSNIDPR